MADRQPPRPGLHLDATGPREVVYCHQCENEWFEDMAGLVCPRCEGEITEIVSPESDPRPGQHTPPTPPELRELQDHNPWGDNDVSDPEEADIEEHITHGPGGSIFVSQTIRSNVPPRRSRFRRNPAGGSGIPNDIMGDFQSMLGNLMGPGFRPGPPGRSGQAELFPPAPMFAFGGGGLGGGEGPRIVGGRVTFTTHPRDSNDRQAPLDLATVVANILGGFQGPPAAADDHDRDIHGGMPPGLQGLLAALFNPVNARAGDAVYSQEALDHIISTLMEQSTSNAPGPASPDAIAALPKKLLDEKLLGPEGKGECSVCMDDVKIGDEVVMLPCNHWFHEACAAAWLGEHNTCPICRKGIEGDESPTATPPLNNRRPSQTGQPGWPRHERFSRRTSSGLGPRSNSSRNDHRLDLGEANDARNESRLNSIRNAGRLSPTDEPAPRRYQIIGDGVVGAEYARQIQQGSFTFPQRRRDSEMTIESQRDGRRGNTSGSDRSRESRRSSGSTSGGGNNNNNSGGSGPISWLRDRFSGDRARRD